MVARVSEDDPRADSGVIALIPARGGSKSIPRKNVRTFAGRPLIEWSIAAALESECIDRVIVSTDDEEIRAVAISCGAEAPFIRPAALARDETTDFPVVAHAVEWLNAHECFESELIVQLRPTSPVRPRGMIDAALARMVVETGADSLRAVTPAGQNPYKMWRINGALMSPLMTHDGPEPFNMPRQRLPDSYWQTGHIDVIRRETLRHGTLTGKRIVPHVVDQQFAVDLDTECQWEQAEWTASKYRADIVWPGITDAELRRFRLLVLDFDGVLTDNTVNVRGDGEETVSCDRSDGLGLSALREHGFPIVVLSSEVHPVVGARCRKLLLPFRQGLANKARALRDYAAEVGVALDDVIYVGNDVNDLECLQLAGLAVVPSDAHTDVRSAAAWILSRTGGHGAVRELCDALIKAHTT